jgi:hypothetical protein
VTQLLRGIRRGVTDFTRGLSRSSDQWPQLGLRLQQQDQQAQQAALRLELEDRRLTNAEEQSEKLAEYRGNTLAHQRLQVELAPIKSRLAENNTMLIASIKAGVNPNKFEAERESLYGQWRDLTEKYAPSNYAMQTVQQMSDDSSSAVREDEFGRGEPTISLPPLPIGPSVPDDDSAIREGEVWADPATASDESSSSPFAEMALTARERLLAEKTKIYASLAEHNVETTVGMVGDSIGGFRDQAEEDEVRKRLTSLRPKARRIYDLDWGISYDPVTGDFKPIEGGPELGEMNKEQFNAALSIMKEWSGNSAMIRMHSMGVMATGAAERGYKQNNAVGDIGLLYGLAKMVAPDDSAVREGEFATMAQAMGWVREQLLLPAKLFEGDKLDKTARRDMWVFIDDLMRGRKEALLEYSIPYAGFAAKAGLDPSWAVMGWDRMDPTSLYMQGTDKLVEQGFTKMTPEIHAELSRRFGIRPGEKLDTVIDGWLTRRATARQWQSVARTQGDKIQRAAQAHLRATVGE